MAYTAQWQGHGNFAFGIQQESYSKDVTSPTLPESHLTDHPLRAYGTAALALSDEATAYAGYTQGLEDSGVASSSAENRGAILPDARTWQADTGIRYLLTPKVKLIAGVFEIEKPYFNRDSSNVDRALGRQRAAGFELSASGEVLRNFNIAAAMLWGEVKVIGPNLKAEGVGSFALNQAKFTATVNASYVLPRLPALSADIAILHFGPYPASVDDAAQGSEATVVSLGGRYRFKILGAAATLRVQVQNLTNVYFWNLSFNAPLFTQYQPRAFVGYLTADF
jgi:iron complex outermembrane receptor protein